MNTYNQIKICHITSSHPRYDKRIYVKEARSLAKLGYDVTIIVQDDNPDEIIDGVKILSSGYNSKNRIDRVLAIRRKLWPLILKTEADIYQIQDPDLLLVGLRLEKRGNRVVFDCHEPYDTYTYPYIPFKMGHLVAKAYGRIERLIVPKLSGVATVNSALVEKFSKYNTNTYLVTNYPVLEELVEKKHNIKRESLCFAGGISAVWNIDKVISLLPMLPSIGFRLAGFGCNFFIEKLQTLAGWVQVDYVGQIPYDEVHAFMGECKVGVALLEYSKTDNSKTGGTLGNTKLFEYMRAGIPVIATDFPNWKEVIEGSNCGICVNPEDDNEIIRAIQYLFDNPVEAERLGENGLTAVKSKYNWDTQLVNLEKLYQTILAE